VCDSNTSLLGKNTEYGAYCRKTLIATSNKQGTTQNNILDTESWDLVYSENHKQSWRKSTILSLQKRN